MLVVDIEPITSVGIRGITAFYISFFNVEIALYILMNIT